MLHIPGGGLDTNDLLLGLRSPNLNPLDFFFGGHLKLLCIVTQVNGGNDSSYGLDRRSFRLHRQHAGLFERVRQSFVRRCQMCYDLFGSNFEQFL
ncbi:hypothetical protein TNCV_4825141 [Trichonephila clavipes]|uniref:Uncharacterized protein n=1 Tax=Trichonephila clavipes TaxID=2585209 RepID=A0A8X6RMZ3_TRICX|nr:hypothetical protein TNCV_4825141 [Trichonephila clavipes]